MLTLLHVEGGGRSTLGCAGAHHASALLGLQQAGGAGGRALLLAAGPGGGVAFVAGEGFCQGGRAPGPQANDGLGAGTGLVSVRHIPRSRVSLSCVRWYKDCTLQDRYTTWTAQVGKQVGLQRPPNTTPKNVFGVSTK